MNNGTDHNHQTENDYVTSSERQALRAEWNHPEKYGEHAVIHRLLDMLDAYDAAEDAVDWFTAEDLRTLAEHMDWLEQGPINGALVRFERHDKPWAWVMVSNDWGPGAQVAFIPPADYADVRLPPASEATPTCNQPFGDGYSCELPEGHL